jgi:hypothetical protein
MGSRVPRIAWLAAALAAASACSCGGCYQAPDCNLHLACDTDAATQPHSTWSSALFGGCVLRCDWGWSDCDLDERNGCETHAHTCTTPADAGPDAGGKVPATLATLVGAPRGLALCGDEVVYVDGDAIEAVPIMGGPPRVVTSFDAAPVSGLACDAESVWVGLGASAAGASDGELVRVALGDGGAASVARGIEPGRGIDLDDASVHWLSRASDDAGNTFVMRTVEDAGTERLMPADERADLYKTFAVRDGVWSAAGGDLLHVRDGSVESSEAGALAVAARTGDIVVLSAGPDGGAELRALADGGLGPALTAVWRPRVLAAWMGVVFVATDDAVVMVPITGAPVVLATGLPHVVDLVADATGVYFTTAGPPARVWSMPWW